MPDCVCLPTRPPTGGRDLSSCLVLSPPSRGGRCRLLWPPGPGECDTMGSAAPSGTVGASVSGTPSLSYMNCPDLVQCVPTPLANLFF